MTQKPFFANIIGNSPQIQEVLRKVEKIGASPATTVLLRGESGTGKDLIMQAIHACSPMGKGPFIELNCAAIPETLLEAELFGYEKGAFTDAHAQKKGLFELANGGTLFLDEIGGMTMSLQAKLLKVIDEKMFRRLGGVEEIHVAMRIAAATNVNLEDAIAKQRFREDLYYRLNVVSLEMPPLRDRGDDAVLIAEHFIARYNEEYHKNVKGLSPGAVELMKSHPWPGNIRELKNVIERAVLLENKEILEPEDLLIDRRVSTPLVAPWSRIVSIGQGAGPVVRERRSSQWSRVTATSIEVDEDGELMVHIPDKGVSLEAVEKRFLEEALRMTRWNARRAAKLLHLSYGTFRYRMQKHGIQ